MRKRIAILLTCILTLFYGQSPGQLFNGGHELNYSKYYPLNEYDYKADTFLTNDLSSFLDAIDTNSNTIYHKLATNSDCRIYKVNGDTIKSYKYNLSKRAFTSVEFFVYNSNKLIALYIDCTDYYFDRTSIPVTAIQFFYNANNELTDKLTYYQKKYSAGINEFSSFHLQDFKLESAIHYKKKKTKYNTYIFGQECIGKEYFRSYDTAVLDNKGLLVRFNSYADNRALGCPMGLFVNDILDYSYRKDSVTVTFTQKNCLIPGIDKKCEVYAEAYISTSRRKYVATRFNYELCAQIRNTSKQQKSYILR